MIWNMRVTAKKENDCEMLYEVILPHLVNGPLPQAIEKVQNFFSFFFVLFLTLLMCSSFCIGICFSHVLQLIFVRLPRIHFFHFLCTLCTFFVCELCVRAFAYTGGWYKWLVGVASTCRHLFLSLCTLLCSLSHESRRLHTKSMQTIDVCVACWIFGPCFVRP